MRFQPVKCNMMQLTRKRINKIHASYTLEGTDLENVESIKYLGVTITSDLFVCVGVLRPSQQRGHVEPVS